MATGFGYGVATVAPQIADPRAVGSPALGPDDTLSFHFVREVEDIVRTAVGEAVDLPHAPAVLELILYRGSRLFDGGQFVTLVVPVPVDRAVARRHLGETSAVFVLVAHLDAIAAARVRDAVATVVIELDPAVTGFDSDEAALQVTAVVRDVSVFNPGSQDRTDLATSSAGLKDEQRPASAAE